MTGHDGLRVRSRGRVGVKDQRHQGGAARKREVRMPSANVANLRNKGRAANRPVREGTPPPNT